MVAVRGLFRTTLLLGVLGLVLTGCPLLFAPDANVVLQVSPTTLDFGATKAQLAFVVMKNTTSREMPPVVASSPQPWIEVLHCTSTADNCVSQGFLNPVRVEVRVDRTRMELGVNAGVIHVQGTGVATQTVDVVARNELLPGFTADARAPQVGQDVRFTDQSVSTNANEPITSWFWEFGDGSSSTFQHPVHAYTRPGVFNVSLRVSTPNRTAEVVREGFVTVAAPLPQAAFEADSTSVFEGGQVQFTDLSEPGSDGPIVAWRWSFGDGGTSTRKNPAHVYVDRGIYTVSLTVETAHGEDTAVAENYVVVKHKVGPTARFTVSTMSPLVNTPVQFTDLSDAGTSPITMYEWHFGEWPAWVEDPSANPEDEFISNDANPEHAYGHEGTYLATLTVYTEHGSDTSAPVELVPRSEGPQAAFTSSLTRALTIDEVAFTDASTAGTSEIAAWSWNFGDPASGVDNVSALENPTHVYGQPGTYTVSLTVTTAVGASKTTEVDLIDVFEPGPLDNYVRTPDDVYGYQPMFVEEGPGATVHVLRMTSQRWRDETEVDKPIWRHWLTVVQPDEVTADTAFLFVTGGRNTDDPPSADDRDLLPLANMAVATGSVVAVLEQVPSEPLLFEGEVFTRSEDAILAYSFRRFKETGDPTWPALLPMVKSAVRAMDTITDYMAAPQAPLKQDLTPVDVEKYIVSGGSKRGWTTWLTAAADPRVVGISPMVIDVLNMEPQMAHHFAAYGYYSEVIQEYVVEDVLTSFDTPEDRALLEIVDPYQYRERLKMPKLLVNSTGDEFFLPDSAQFYFDDLPGENYLAYMPNTTHSLNDAEEVIKTVLPWYEAQLTDTALPEIAWTVVEDEGRIVVRTSETPSAVNLWQATAPNRDFRMNAALNPGAPDWSDSPVAASGLNRYTAQVDVPVGEWRGFFVEVEFDSPFLYQYRSVPYRFCSELRVVPTEMPVHPDPDTMQPEPDFSASPLEPLPMGEVHFTDASLGVGRPIIAWEWDFGDPASGADNVSRDQNPTHVYSALGSYDVSLTVLTVYGMQTITKPGYVVVRGTKVPPEAAFSADTTTVRTFEPVSFVDESEAGSAPIHTWQWNFGDGAVSYQPNPQHAYAEVGTYTVSLTVISDDGTDTLVQPRLVSVLASSPVEAFVAEPDAYYGLYGVHSREVVAGAPGESYTAHVLDLSSQQWRGATEVDRPVWQHWLTIVEPEFITTDMALLVIAGGEADSLPPAAGAEPYETLVAMALETGSVVLYLQNVPNAPLLFEGAPHALAGDDLAAYSFGRFMDSYEAGTPDTSWPVLMPMVKSVVCAMDTAETYMAGLAQPVDLNDFVLTGAWLRGWAAWLAAAVDTRVAGVVPVAAEVLAWDEQVAHQRACYGYYAQELYPFVQEDVLPRLDSGAGEALLNIIDPKNYLSRDVLEAMPKFVVSGTADGRAQLDAAQFYVDDVQGTLCLNVVPGAPGVAEPLDDGAAQVMPVYAALVQRRNLPEATWTFEGASTIRVESDVEPSEVMLYQAYVPDGRRDFRAPEGGWTATPVAASPNGAYVAETAVPTEGWRAFFVQVRYEEFTAGRDLVCTTPVRLAPDVYPEFASYRTSVMSGDREIPVCVVYGSPYDMGWAYGDLMKAEVQAFVPAFLDLIQTADPELFSDAELDAAWNATAPYVDHRFTEELEGLAAGAGVSATQLRRAHMAPLLDSFSCSSVAVWGDATADGSLFQSRNLDWTLDAGAQDYPVIVVYIPDEGAPHVNFSFAGWLGCHTGMNLAGVIVTQMGDSPASDRPYDLHGEHFQTLFREILYDDLSLSAAIDSVESAQRIKKYHYVIGDGRNERAAVKIKAHRGDPLEVYTDNDPNDPNAEAGRIFVDAVYNDEGRGAGPMIAEDYGALTFEDVQAISNAIPIEGANILSVVFDGANVSCIVSYAEGNEEAYERSMAGDFATFRMLDYLP